jgi:hypothetical protein
MDDGHVGSCRLDITVGAGRKTCQVFALVVIASGHVLHHFDWIVCMGWSHTGTSFINEGRREMLSRNAAFAVAYV